MDDQKVVRSVIADAIEFATQGPGTRCAPKAKSVLGPDESMRIAAAVLGALAGQEFQAVECQRNSLHSQTTSRSNHGLLLRKDHSHDSKYSSHTS